jgi:hypothetical protein
LFVILCAAALPSVSHAGLLKCDSRQITAQDFEKATSAARRIAGKSKLAKGLPSICMNPGRGRLWFEGEPEPQADGSVINPHFLCTREIGPWSCEALETRVATFAVLRDGVEHALVFELPADLAMTDARPMVTRAFELGPALRESQECEQAREPNDAQAGTERAFAPGDFDPAKQSYWREIQAQANGDMAVVIDGNGIVFSRAPDGTWNFSCWNVWITVT